MFPNFWLEENSLLLKINVQVNNDNNSSVSVRENKRS